MSRLNRLHLAIADRFRAGDRLIYLGGFLGDSDCTPRVDHILAFRTYLLAAPGMISNDIVYLRGVQEEIWSKLLQIQYAPNPAEILRWMLERGASETILAYGGNPNDGISAAREGARSMARWTNSLRNAVRGRPGHDKLLSVLHRAAMTDADGGGRLLFVHAGLDPTRALDKQGDSFWWAAAAFSHLAEPYEGFARIFRGSDPSGGGSRLEGYAVTLDAGKQPDAPLLAVEIGPDGEILGVIES